MMDNSHQITELLIAWNEGDEEALDRLMPMVEAELRRIASAYMSRESGGHTLQTDALVNEAYLKLIDQRQANWQNRTHFFALAAKLMRRILIDHAKTQKRDKRGGGALHFQVDSFDIAVTHRGDELIALDAALLKLAEFDPVKSRIVEMRHFGGLSVDETAEVLKVAPITVIRHWQLAKAWFQRELR